MAFTRTYLLLLSLVAFLVPGVSDQQDTAIVVGVVSDQSGAVVPNADVRLTNLSTNTVTEVHTDERGEYRTPPLRIGAYELQVELQGFKRFVQRDVVLNIADVRSINPVLEAGAVTENVTVEAAAPLLQAADSTVGTVITNREIGDLPLNGRDYLQLAVLSSGTTATSGIGISIGGHAGTDAAFLLDGQDNNNQQIATTHSNQKEVIKPSVDAVQEFRVVTNGYSAEYGRSSSGVVTVSLKSGTNEFHGGAWEFLRNDAADARNFFAAQKPAFRRNQFGGDIGGPIIHNRTFFFGDIEASLIRQSATTVSTLPSAAQRSGLFTTTIVDPLSGLPFPGNQIPASRFDPASLRILSHVILPQTAASANNFVYNSPANQDPRSGDVRLDQILSPTQNFFIRYSYQKRNNGVAESLPPDAQGNYYANGGAERNLNKSYVATYNRVWSPKIVTTVRAGYNGTYWDRFLPDQALKGIGLPGITWNYPNIPGINITGYQSVTNRERR